MKLKKIILLSIAGVVSVTVAYSIYTIWRERAYGQELAQRI